MKPDYDNESSFYFGRDLAVPFYLADADIDDDWNWTDAAQPQTSLQMFSNSVSTANQGVGKPQFYSSRKAQIGVKSMSADVFFGTDTEAKTMEHFQTLVASLTSITIVPENQTKFGDLTLYRCKDQIVSFWAKLEFLAMAMSKKPATPHLEESKIVLPFSFDEIAVLEGAPFDLVIAHHPESFRAIPMVVISGHPILAKESFRYYANHFKRVMFDLLAHYFADEGGEFDACVDKLIEEFGIPDFPPVVEEARSQVVRSATGKRWLRMTRAPNRSEQLSILSKNFGFRFADVFSVGETALTQDDPLLLSRKSRQVALRSRPGDAVHTWFMYPANTYYSDIIDRRVHRAWEFSALAISQAPVGRDLALSTVKRIAEKVGFASLIYASPLMQSIREFSILRFLTEKTAREMATLAGGGIYNAIYLWEAINTYTRWTSVAETAIKADLSTKMIFLETFIRIASNYTLERGGYAPLIFTKKDVSIHIFAKARESATKVASTSGPILMKTADTMGYVGNKVGSAASTLLQNTAQSIGPISNAAGEFMGASGKNVASAAGYVLKQTANTAGSAVAIPLSAVKMVFCTVVYSYKEIDKAKKVESIKKEIAVMEDLINEYSERDAPPQDKLASLRSRVSTLRSDIETILITTGKLYGDPEFAPMKLVGVIGFLSTVVGSIIAAGNNAGTLSEMLKQVGMPEDFQLVKFLDWVHNSVKLAKEAKDAKDKAVGIEYQSTQFKKVGTDLADIASTFAGEVKDSFNKVLLNQGPSTPQADETSPSSWFYWGGNSPTIQQIVGNINETLQTIGESNLTLDTEIGKPSNQSLFNSTNIESGTNSSSDTGLSGVLTLLCDVPELVVDLSKRTGVLASEILGHATNAVYKAGGVYYDASSKLGVQPEKQFGFGAVAVIYKYLSRPVELMAPGPSLVRRRFINREFGQF